MAHRQSAFAITACGHDCTLRALPFETPTPAMAAKMALQVRADEWIDLDPVEISS